MNPIAEEIQGRPAQWNNSESVDNTSQVPFQPKQTTRGHLQDYNQPSEIDDVRVVRGTRYGNIFAAGQPHPDTGEKMSVDDACELFEERQLPFMDVEPLRGMRLLCTCPSDQRCHADSIIKKLEGAETAAPDDLTTQIVGRAAAGLDKVCNGENLCVEGWIEYGTALNEGRKLFPNDDKRFGWWVSSSKLAEYADGRPVHDADRQAAMWAAANLETFEALRGEYPKVRTVRGLHAKWKLDKDVKAVGEQTQKLTVIQGGATEARQTAKPLNLQKAAKLHGLIKHPSTDENVRENAQRQLDSMMPEVDDPELTKWLINEFETEGMFGDWIEIVEKHPKAARVADAFFNSVDTDDYLSLAEWLATQPEVVSALEKALIKRAA